MTGHRRHCSLSPSSQKSAPKKPHSSLRTRSCRCLPGSRSGNRCRDAPTEVRGNCIARSRIGQAVATDRQRSREPNHRHHRCGRSVRRTLRWGEQDSNSRSAGDGELCWGALALGCIGEDRSAGAGTVQCDFFCSAGFENAQATRIFPAQHRVSTCQRSQQPTP